MWKSNTNLVVNTAQNIVAIQIEQTESPCHDEEVLMCSAPLEMVKTLRQREKVGGTTAVLCLSHSLDQKQKAHLISMVRL